MLCIDVFIYLLFVCCMPISCSAPKDVGVMNFVCSYGHNCNEELKLACVLLWRPHVCSGNGNTTNRERVEEIYRKKLVVMFGI